jgi:hypothetical protein
MQTAGAKQQTELSVSEVQTCDRRFGHFCANDMHIKGLLTLLGEAATRSAATEVVTHNHSPWVNPVR